MSIGFVQDLSICDKAYADLRLLGMPIMKINYDSQELNNHSSTELWNHNLCFMF
jgi:hypothetical protein